MMGHLDKLLAPTAEAMGYDLVRVTLLGSQSPTLQVMAERQDEQPMTVSDCEALSRALSALLDVEDPIKGRFNLEVSSPGIDRPLTRLKDFQRFAGHEARVETDRLIDGHRRVKGVLLGTDDDRNVLLRLEGAPKREDGSDPELTIPFGAIVKAKLLLTDELIARALRQAKQAERDAENDNASDPVEGGEG
ncbi:ribosome maturation factor RimP [Rhodospirillum sp. A1_3_36]|uniref:ribosome maturation factor RimP n=1 Tax=Rhodospirillum sp. A1_3_36 TaxID=3391666 RepID=UPI0039A71A71